ncbi:glycosyltransferase family 2 protein [Algoriphagus persicinus]|uniref:glycosyltransferase family 2 protein n=1 Tax=Algoriphagus persicinus TaxID=3108754 RepID=UPI002B3E56AF|nr:glycosyltransferase family 2 protein [Algoriphagus sp. E1-3-M2]MEB2784733.1 glycosyltransferase family 2 protein [Algoriphagus sp. E1-3-M2]
MISIVIPTLNRPGELIRLLKKIRNSETDSDLEVIIVDDSKEDISNAVGKIIKSGIYYIHRGEKLGVSSARNAGAEVAKGEFLIFLDDDDDFTEDWLSDFHKEARDGADLVFCDMKRVESNGNKRIEKSIVDKNGKLIKSILIPGAWMLRKELFFEIGGYDEKLKYAENTELFIRLQQVDLCVKRIPKANFIYYPSEDGGSKNLMNMINSLSWILQKQESQLSPHVKYLYHQIIGVNYMRFQDFPNSRMHLLKAYLIKMYKLDTLGRLVISCIPPIARILYPAKP